jgi:hypothetical protein
MRRSSACLGGAFVAGAIRRDGRSLNQLAGLCGMDAARLSRFVRGERGLSIGALDHLFRTLRLRVTGPRRGRPEESN